MGGPALIQCVPNFSEGRRLDVVEAIADAARSGPGARLVDHSADPDHNRCVLTLVGPPAGVLAAALAAARVAVARIDLRSHQGAHPRIGALDVLPFVPLEGATMADCVALARRAGAALADELGLPVYLYGEAASTPARRDLPAVRAPGFEGLAAGPLTGDRSPDFGPAAVHPTAGAVAVGARGPLIAYNVLLQTDDVEIARRVAARVRERDGGLPGVRALGLALPSRGCVQVSVNVTRPEAVSLGQVFDRIREEAARLGAPVLGSELIGALRLGAVLDTVTHYLALGALPRERVLDLWTAAMAPETVLGEERDGD